jgi:proline iminopeptidase
MHIGPLRWRRIMDIRAPLYAPVEPHDSGMLALDDLHTMYWESVGNPHGIPVLFLHGGPGGGCSPEHRRFFDPDFYRAVLFDQRGAGASTPLGEVQSNTTQHLIADIETLREYLGIERWLIFGGSWGSTLGLAYGQAHPERCSGFLLRGIFLGRQSEVDWFLYGARQVFPEAWQRFSAMVPEAERDDLLRAYLKRLFDPDPRVHVGFARAWSEYEGSCSTLLPNPELVRHFAAEAIGLARLEAHYFAHRCFLAPGQLLDGIDRIRRHPAAIVHARYDMVCPIVSADDLSRAWPSARYTIVPDAGHSVWEPAVRATVLAELDRFKSILA